ncbi:MAG: hypothetical protein ACO1QR_16955 [Chthoniobacteraceae bacterium]
MKSAYELAMERLEQQSPTAQLTEAQKAEIAEIDSTYKAKLAEREVFLRDQIAKAEFEGRSLDAAELHDQLVREIRRINEDCEEKKERVRAQRG